MATMDAATIAEPETDLQEIVDLDLSFDTILTSLE
jgi:hypothetical protein